MITTPARVDHLLSGRARIPWRCPVGTHRPVTEALYEFGRGFPDPSSFPYDDVVEPTSKMMKEECGAALTDDNPRGDRGLRKPGLPQVRAVRSDEGPVPLASELGGRRLRVLIGENQSELAEFLSRCVEATAASKDQVSVISSPPHADEILRRCRDTTFALLILILNNIVFPEIAVGARPARQERWLRFIAEVKSLSRCPMIVFCGWMEDHPVLDGLHMARASAAGANLFFPMPAPTSQIIDAINKCLWGEP